MAGAIAHVTTNLNKLKSLVDLNNPANLEARDQILSKLKVIPRSFLGRSAWFQISSSLPR